MIDRRVRRAGALLAVLLVSTPGSARPADWQNRIASRWEGGGATANAASGMNLSAPVPILSSDGRYVAFDSAASDLLPTVPTLHAHYRNAYLSDLAGGGPILVSHAAGDPGRAGNGPSTAVALSGSGRFVLIGSEATDLVDGAVDTAGSPDVFVHDRDSGRTEAISVVAGTAATLAGEATPVGISDDGDVVLFMTANNAVLAGVSGSAPSDRNLYLRRRSTGSTRLVNHGYGAPLRAVSGVNGPARLSADGRFVVYQSYSTEQVAGVDELIHDRQVYLYDALTDTTVYVSHAPADPARAGVGPVDLIHVDPGVGHVLYASFFDGWSYDRTDGTVSRMPANGVVAASDDGRFVAYSATTPPPGVIDTTPAPDAYLLDRRSGAITLLSHAVDAAQRAANGASVPIAVSADGRRVLFRSAATDLVAGQQDDNGGDDLFLYERGTGAVTLLSGAAGDPAHTAARPLQWARLAAGGGVAVFSSAAADLSTEPDLNEVPDLVAVDLDRGTRRLLSRATVARPAALGYFAAAFTPDLRRMVIALPAAGAIGLDATPSVALQLLDVDRERRSLLARFPRRFTSPGAIEDAVGVALSADGAYAGFTGRTRVPGVAGGEYITGVFLLEVASGRLRLVSRRVDRPELAAIGFSLPVCLSRDGRYLAYLSTAEGLVTGVVSGGPQQAYVYDRVADRSTLASVAFGTDRVGGDGASQPVAISADGRFLLMASAATDLVPSGLPRRSNPRVNVYQRDLALGRTRLVSHRRGAAVAGEGESRPVGMSADGRYVLFNSPDPALTATTDDNDAEDVFVWDRDSDRTALVSHTPDGRQSGSAASTARAISDDGRTVLFDSLAGDLGADAGAGRSQVYLADRGSGRLTLVSHTAGSATRGAAGGARGDALSTDGRCVAFSSASNDLVGPGGLPGENVYRWCRDRPTRRVTAPAAVSAGRADAASSRAAAVSAEGDIVIFVSTSAQLDDRTVDPNDQYDLLIGRDPDAPPR